MRDTRFLQNIFEQKIVSAVNTSSLYGTSLKWIMLCVESRWVATINNSSGDLVGMYHEFYLGESRKDKKQLGQIRLHNRAFHGFV